MAFLGQSSTSLDQRRHNSHLMVSLPFQIPTINGMNYPYPATHPYIWASLVRASLTPLSFISSFPMQLEMGIFNGDYPHRGPFTIVYLIRP